MPPRISLAVAALVLASLAPPARAQDAAADMRSSLQDLRQRVLKLEGAPAKATLGSFNPAVGMAFDAVFHDSNDKASFQLRAAELSIEAPCDPYLKGWAVVNGSNAGVEVEEAALETTSLPYNLTARGGRLFAAFGRLAHFHGHELPVVERPNSLNSYIGSETQGDGLEVSWLAPSNLFLNATFGIYNKMGATNARQDNPGARALDEFTYLGRLATYADLTDSQSVELGAGSAWSPKRAVTDAAGAVTTRRNTWRTLNGLDVTYRYQPPQGGLYRGLSWGAEVLQNDERRFDASTKLPTDRVRSYAGYSFVEAKFSRRWRGGAMVDLTEDQDDPHRLAKTFTGFLTCDVTQFQRLRLAFAEAVVNVPSIPKNHTVALQWTGVIGKHVHGFRDR